LAKQISKILRKASAALSLLKKTPRLQAQEFMVWN
jgi:hypothetical protein